MTRRPARPGAATGPLHVGLNLFYLGERAGGAGTYARELIRGILAVEPATRITAFVTAELPRDIVEESWGGDVRWERLPGELVHGRRPWSPLTSAFSQWVLEPGRARARGVDVLHGLANVAPVVATMPTVVTMLDVIWLHHPDVLAPADVLGMKVLGLTSARRADRVIAISQAGKDDLVETVGLDPARIDVTMLGVRAGQGAPATPEGELRQRLGLGRGRLVLCVAQKRVHKNLDGLLRAFALLDDPDATLVLPGAPTPHEEELRALAAALGIAERVRFLDWVSAEDLEGLFAAAEAFVLPSLIEGFGLPIVEAMQRGLPVACSDVSSLPEVAGGAALLFDPHDEGAIAGAIGHLLGDAALRAQLAARGRARCAELTWEHTARDTLAVYRRAIAAR